MVVAVNKIVYIYYVAVISLLVLHHDSTVSAE